MSKVNFDKQNIHAHSIPPLFILSNFSQKIINRITIWKKKKKKKKKKKEKKRKEKKNYWTIFFIIATNFNEPSMT